MFISVFTKLTWLKKRHRISVIWWIQISFHMCVFIFISLLWFMIMRVCIYCGWTITLCKGRWKCCQWRQFSKYKCVSAFIYSFYVLLVTSSISVRFSTQVCNNEATCTCDTTWAGTDCSMPDPPKEPEVPQDEGPKGRFPPLSASGIW